MERVVAAQSAGQGVATGDGDRSLPVSAADVGAAEVALARSGPQLEHLAEVLTAGGPAAAELVGELSDRTWGRVGTDDLSPADLAYLDEVCASYHGWSELPDVGRSPVERFLAVFHRPCRTAPTSGAAAPPRIDRRPTFTRSCVIASPDDPVTSDAYAQAWAAALPGSLLITQEMAAHGQGDVSACMTHIQPA